MAPQFSLKQLLISSTLIAIGLPWIAFAILHGDDNNQDRFGVILPLLLWFGSAACVGAGIFNLVGRPYLGALFGIIAVLILFVYLWTTVGI